MSAMDVPAVRRRVREAAIPSKFSGIGVRAAAALLKHASFDSADGVAAMRRPVEALAASLEQLEPLELFSEWSPPRDPAPVSVPLAPTATASAQKNSEFDASKALQADQQTLWQSGSTKSAWWSVALDGTSAAPISVVRITFRPSQLPETVVLEVTKSGGSSSSWAPAATVTGKAVRELTVVELPEPSSVRMASVRLAVGPCHRPNLRHPHPSRFAYNSLGAKLHWGHL